MPWLCGVGTSNVTHAQFAEYRLWMLAYDVRPRVRRTFTDDRTASSYGASATTRFTTVACPYG